MDTYKSESLPVYLSPIEAPHLLRLSPMTVEKHRVYGTGLSFRKIDCTVIHAATDLVAWAETGAKASTSDPHCGAGKKAISVASVISCLQAGAAASAWSGSQTLRPTQQAEVVFKVDLPARRARL